MLKNWMNYFFTFGDHLGRCGVGKIDIAVCGPPHPSPARLTFSWRSCVAWQPRTDNNTAQSLATCSPTFRQEAGRRTPTVQTDCTQAASPFIFIVNESRPQTFRHQVGIVCYAEVFFITELRRPPCLMNVSHQL